MAGQDIRLCEKTILSEGNPAYGIPPQYGYSCRKIDGHVNPNKEKKVVVEGGSTTYLNQPYSQVWIMPQANFNPKEITPETYLWFQGDTYQLEQEKTITHCGVDIFYVYGLRKTTLTGKLQFQD